MEESRRRRPQTRKGRNFSEVGTGAIRALVSSMVGMNRSRRRGLRSRVWGRLWDGAAGKTGTRAARLRPGIQG